MIHFYDPDTMELIFDGFRTPVRNLAPLTTISLVGTWSEDGDYTPPERLPAESDRAYKARVFKDRYGR